MLTDSRLKALRAKPEPGKHADRDGLYVRVTDKGGMYWQWRIRVPKESTVSYGTYPEVSLAEARERHLVARKQQRNGANPNALRKAAKQAASSPGHSFESVAREWFNVRQSEWAPTYANKVIARLKADVFPFIGKMPVDELKPTDLLLALRKIEERGAVESAHRALESCGQILRYCVSTGRLTSDPSRDLRGALRKPMVRHMAAITTPMDLAALLRAIDGYSGTYVVRAALQLAPLLMVRPGELRFATWDEFDLRNALWTIPAARMKRERAGKLHGEPHAVPLPRQAIAVLKSLSLVTGPSGYVFRGERDHERAMSENTINAALRRMGYDTKTEVTGHGFRATARTILDEELGFDPSVIEAQLAHAVKDSLGRAYNRTTFLQQRQQMMQSWADYLDKLRSIAIPQSDNRLTPGLVADKVCEPV